MNGIIRLVKIHRNVNPRNYKDQWNIESRIYYISHHSSSTNMRRTNVNTFEILEKSVYSSRWTSLLGRSSHEWNVHHYRKRYLGLFNDRIEKHLRGGDRFIIIGVIDDRARGSCLRRASWSARGSVPWMRTIHQHCKSIRLNAISLGEKKAWQACQLISSMIIRDIYQLWRN